MEFRAIFPGTFDPVHFGHLDVIQRAAAIFGPVAVVVLINPAKSPWFSAEERMAMVAEALGDVKGVAVRQSRDLAVRAARALGATLLIRGVRNAADWAYEAALAEANRRLDPAVHTVFMATDPSWAHLSSSLVKEMAAFGADLSSAVPAVVAQRLHDRVRTQNTPSPKAPSGRG
ncbi:MAG: pantetheine-phosphate adenylyltransferase [Firmicutes bacterium]|nr:pantetheine-phosphate adenylyltransferase [Alicyclobacillaceae bacterium]MCL6496388.1 pantetheine-phosphate adenylyltransferase [Bacillota bacterium]